MRRWMCCAGKKGVADSSTEELHMKSPWQNSDGMLYIQEIT